MTIGKMHIPSWLAAVIASTILAAATGLCAQVLSTQQALDSRLSAEEAGTREVLRRLDRIDDKLDRLLERP